MKEHIMTCDEVLKEQEVNLKKGLTSLQVEERKEKYGLNKLKEDKKKTIFQRFIAQFKDAMILVLLAAAVISFVIAIIEKNPKELFEPFLILLIVFVNAVMGVIQENKAEKALEALANMSSPHARVIRDGKEMKIESIGETVVINPGSLGENGFYAWLEVEKSGENWKVVNSELCEIK